MKSSELYTLRTGNYVEKILSLEVGEALHFLSQDGKLHTRTAMNWYTAGAKFWVESIA